jgi:hypothetical protein
VQFGRRTEASASRRASSDPTKDALLPNISDESVWFDVAHIDVDNHETVINMLVLHELMDRSIRGRDLLESIELFIESAIATVKDRSLAIRFPPEG